MSKFHLFLAVLVFCVGFSVHADLKGGTGKGTVISNPSGINCGTICSAVYPGGTIVTLTALADQGSTFTGWSGACTGTGDCVVNMNQAQNVIATFALKPVSPVGLYDGIYQWGSGYFLSVHQLGGGALVGTMYWMY